VTAHPDVATAVPAVVATDPEELGAWRNRHDLDLGGRRGRGRVHDDFGLDGRGGRGCRANLGGTTGERDDRERDERRDETKIADHLYPPRKGKVQRVDIQFDGRRLLDIRGRWVAPCRTGGETTIEKP
jgi:hypothetical protein